MKNFIQKQKELVVISAYIMVIIMLIYFVVVPLVSKINETNDQIQKERINQNMIEQKIAELPKIQQQYNTILEKENIIDVFLDKNEEVGLIEKIEKLAQDTDNKIEISVQSNQPQTKNTDNKKKKKVEETLVSKLPSTDYLQMQIILNGSYNDMLNFIRRLENMENYSDIIKIKIEQTDSNAITNSNFGSANPFVQAPSTDSEDTANSVIEKDLKTTMDIVFYTKK